MCFLGFVIEGSHTRLQMMARTRCRQQRAGPAAYRGQFVQRTMLRRSLISPRVSILLQMDGRLECLVLHLEISTILCLVRYTWWTSSSLTALLHPERKRVDYEAPSYSWGTADASQTLLCNGYQTSVSPNLALAFRHLRQQGQPSDRCFLHQPGQSAREKYPGLDHAYDLPQSEKSYCLARGQRRT